MRYAKDNDLNYGQVLAFSDLVQIGEMVAIANQVPRRAIPIARMNDILRPFMDDHRRAAMKLPVEHRIEIDKLMTAEIRRRFLPHAVAVSP
jgi:hypothetical protein